MQLTWQWQYKVLELDVAIQGRPQQYEKILDEVGRDGWEMVHSDPGVYRTPPRSEARESRIVFFKRRANLNG